MSKILVTGFRPFGFITPVTGNPSEAVARTLGERYGSGAEVVILDADETCLPRLAALGQRGGFAGVLMFGAALQARPMVLELEGVSKADGLLGALQARRPSTAAAAQAGFAATLGVPTAKAPPTPLVYWCLRSYAAALAWAEPAGIPCLFLHVNMLRVSGRRQDELAAHFFERLRGAG